MKISVKQLQQLIKEAVFTEPPRVSTAGTGLWSMEKRKEQDGPIITKLVLELSTYDKMMKDDFYSNKKQIWTHLKVYFTNWSVREEGLIYTDPGFIRSFRKILMTMGFSQRALRGIDYTEQGMQGRNYVSMQVNTTFVEEWRDLVGEHEESIEL